MPRERNYPDAHIDATLEFMLRWLVLTALVGGCVGDSSSGGDAGPDGAADASPNDVQQNDVAPNDAGADASDAATCPPPATALTANCNAPMVACLRQNQITCETTGNCIYLNGAGRQLTCGSKADCGGGAVCCTNMMAATSTSCPEVISVANDLTNIATQCSKSTTNTCASGDFQVCLTSAECVSGACRGAVFDVNGTQTVKFGTCQ